MTSQVNHSQTSSGPSSIPDSSKAEVVWRPQVGPQKALVDCPLAEIFFGGARGGGKTDGVLGKYALKAKRYGQHFNAIFFRRELPSLDDAIERSKELYGALGCKWNEQYKTWRFPWGGRIRFRPLERVQDAGKYQGQNITDACVEEAGEYPESAPIDRLNGILRSAHGVPTQLILTGNPGGPGHAWLKMRYIDPAPQGMQILERRLPNGRIHKYVFIPSRLENNRILVSEDPDYESRLYLVGTEALVRAWREGDWNVVAGAFFPEFNLARHVIEPFEIPVHWVRIRAGDWGSAKPFCIGWYAVSDGQPVAGNRLYPKGALIKYREWYGMQEGHPNVGLRLTAETVADGILSRELKERDSSGRPVYEKVDHAVIDPAAFISDGGPSIAERMGMRGVWFTHADNARASGRGAMGGWDLLRERLKGEFDEPMVYFFANCLNTIRTLPLMQHDQNRPEDMDTDGEDHAADETRYACASRPWVRSPPQQQQPKFAINQSVNELIAARRKKRLENQ